MEWSNTLISYYLYVCKAHETKLSFFMERFSRHSDLKFSDEEVMTIYLYGIVEKRRMITEIYDFTKNIYHNMKADGFTQKLPMISQVLMDIVQQKNLYHHGVKLHVCAIRQKGILPIPLFLQVTNASEADIRVYEKIFKMLLSGIKIFADKAYQTEGKPIKIQEDNKVLLTLVKKKKGQKSRLLGIWHLSSRY